jgi:hypothetical protein
MIFWSKVSPVLDSGYYQLAAVVIGSVLEDGLRKLCERHEVPLSVKPRLDTMNADLAKKGVYNKLTQKRITVLADIRNKPLMVNGTSSPRLMSRLCFVMSVKSWKHTSRDSRICHAFPAFGDSNT